MKSNSNELPISVPLSFNNPLPYPDKLKNGYKFAIIE